MTSMMTGSSVNARAVRLSAPSAQLQPVRFLGSVQPLQRHQSTALVATRRTGLVIAKAATEEKPDVAQVTTPPSLPHVVEVLSTAMPLRNRRCDNSPIQYFRLHVPAYSEADRTLL